MCRQFWNLRSKFEQELRIYINLFFRPGAASMKNQRKSPISQLMTTSLRNTLTLSNPAPPKSVGGASRKNSLASTVGTLERPQAVPRRGTASSRLMTSRPTTYSETTAADSCSSESSSSLEAQLTKLSSLIEQRATETNDSFDLDAHLETIKQALLKQKAKALAREEDTS